MRRALIPTFLWVLAAGAALAVSPARAAQAPSGPGDSLPPVHAVRLTSPVSVDGALTEPAWQGAPGITRLVQIAADRGRGREREHLGVDRLRRRGPLRGGAHVGLAPRLDHRPAHAPRQLRPHRLRGRDPRPVPRPPHAATSSSSTPSGALMDATTSNDGEEDDVLGRRVGGARAARPAGAGPARCGSRSRSCASRRASDQVWGDQLRPLRRRAGPRSPSPSIKPKAESGFELALPAPRGHRGREGAGAPIELSPYVTGKAEYLARPAGDPFNDGSRYTPAVGGDLRTSLGSNLTLNATVNPDFGQVEVDPAVVNLSDVESFYQEKRPFFTENSRVFSFGTDGRQRLLGHQLAGADVLLQPPHRPRAAGRRAGRRGVRGRADGDAHPRGGEADRASPRPAGTSARCRR